MSNEQWTMTNTINSFIHTDYIINSTGNPIDIAREFENILFWSTPSSHEEIQETFFDKTVVNKKISCRDAVKR